MKKRAIVSVFIISIAVLAACFFSFRLYRTNMQEQQKAIEAAYADEALSALYSYFDSISCNDDGEYSNLCAANYHWKLVSANESNPGQFYSYTVKLTMLDLDLFFCSMEDDVQRYLTQKVAEASRLSDVYDDDLNYLPELLDSAVDNALSIRLENIGSYLDSIDVDAKVIFTQDGTATVTCSADLDSLLLFTVPGRAEDYAQSAVFSIPSKLDFIPLEYAIPDSAVGGCTPDPDGYGETNDPEVIQALLESPRAVQLIGDRDPLWDPSKSLPGTCYKYYFDESILVLVWYERTADACGTYMEVFLSDASQLRRKLSSDNEALSRYALGTDLSSNVNAVAASSGDLYDHWQREIGICVNNGEITRFSRRMCDECWVTRNGDFLITFENDITDYDSALAFIKENNIVFSLCFGPALIKDGSNVTPPSYAWGETTEDYPRCAIAQIGPLHYLSLTVTSARSLGCSDWGCTVSQLGEALMSHHAMNAYALDGGQTAQLMLDNTIVTPFGYDGEQNVSDIIYYASAVPD